MNLCCLSKSAPFDVFKHFGFVSGRDTDKFADKEDKETERSQNGLIIVKEHTNAFMSLKTESIDRSRYSCDVYMQCNRGGSSFR